MSDFSTAFYNDDTEFAPELEYGDTPAFWERHASKLRALKRAPSISLMEAARRGFRWAVRRVATLSRAVTSAPGAALTEADKRFLTWLAQAAIAFYFSENQSTAEG